MKDKLLALRKNCYAPYSQFCVTAICQLDDGQITSGVNIENSAYPVGICAERVAIGQAITLGYHKNNISKIYLYTDSEKLGSPCGMCRQFISEVVNQEIEIEIYNKKGDYYCIKVKELLPYLFSSEDLIYGK